ncbi:MAG: NADH-quinone oxidoreductase subunit NuoN [Micrococcales bacterium]|nr:NADH-quinone oxidoreductase subunit NuoN [Micrococcales bacterium]MCL2666568.1 NADH-quinone oxidoreductase subunit NuoN [Micrococcales bacterium]
MTGFDTPQVDWALVAPVLIVLGAAVVGVLLEAFVPAAARRVAQLGVSVTASVAALGAIGWSWHRLNGIDGTALYAMVTPDSLTGFAAPLGALVVDGMTLVSQAIVVVVALLSVLVMADRTASREDAFTPMVSAVPGSQYEQLATSRRMQQTEVYPLVLFATGGMMVFSATADLLTMFVALEVLSLPLYLLSGMARRRRLQSQEASLKYFLLGSFASALFIFGAALIYGSTGSLSFTEIAAATVSPNGLEKLLLVGVLLLMVGLFFKVGAVPFHLWTPDVYQGAPTPITGFMAAGTKVAAFVALVRVVYVMLPGMGWDLAVLVWTVAIATMVVGSVAVLVQNDIKRLLAYSSVAHAGFVLTAVAAGWGTGDKTDGPWAVLVYLLAYALATVGAFTIVALVRERSADGGTTGEATALSQWAGLGRTNPVIAGCFTVFLLSFAGIPLTAGFVGKFAVFAAAVQAGAWPLALVGVLASAVAAFAYFKVIVLMYFPGRDAKVEDAEINTGAGGATVTMARPKAATVVATQGWAAVTIGVCALLSVLLGILPGGVLTAINNILL